MTASELDSLLTLDDDPSGAFDISELFEGDAELSLEDFDDDVLSGLL